MVVPVIAITIVVLAFVVVLIWKRAGSPRELSKKSARWFLAVGLLYMLIAVVVTALVSGTESVMNDLMNMDLTLFNLGLLLFIIGLGGTLLEKLRARAQ
jgi:heme A synthase